jgi:hypothetical protein
MEEGEPPTRKIKLSPEEYISALRRMSEGELIAQMEHLLRDRNYDMAHRALEILKRAVVAREERFISLWRVSIRHIDLLEAGVVGTDRAWFDRARASGLSAAESDIVWIFGYVFADDDREARGLVVRHFSIYAEKLMLHVGLLRSKMRVKQIEFMHPVFAVHQANLLLMENNLGHFASNPEIPFSISHDFASALTEPEAFGVVEL